LAPLPPDLPAELTRSRASKVHANVAKSWKAARAEVLPLQGEVDAAERADAESARAVARQSKSLPPGKAGEVREALALAERDLALVGDELVHATDEVLAAAASVAPEMEARCDEAAHAAQQGARAALLSAISSLDRSGEAEGQASWWNELHAAGAVVPYQAGAVSRQRQQQVRAALGFMDARAEKRAAHLAEVARLQAHEARLPLPPDSPPAPEAAPDVPVAS
jgi:hypothetical protein